MLSVAPIKTALAIFCAAAVAVVALSSDTTAQSLSNPAGSQNDEPIPAGADQFICCRAMLFDCRVKIVWALKTVRGNADDQRCVAACLKKLKCEHAQSHDWTAPDRDDIHSATRRATHEIPT